MPAIFYREAFEAATDGKPLDGIPFHPYYTVKDVVGVGIFLLLFCVVMFFVPTLNGLFLEPANFTPADPLSTPADIVPSWYFTPYYAILRAVPDLKYGALLMLLSVLVWFFLPWLDRSPVKSIRYRGWLCRAALTIFTVSFLVLMYCGMKPAVEPYRTIARVAMIGYFAFFVLMPFYTKWDKPRPVPTRVSFHHD